VLCVSNEAFAAAMRRPSTQRGDCRDQADSETHDIFRVLVEMMLWQSAAKLRAQKDAAQAQYEYDG
jgi:hypothetical protein